MNNKSAREGKKAKRNERKHIKRTLTRIFATSYTSSYSPLTYPSSSSSPYALIAALPLPIPMPIPLPLILPPPPPPIVGRRVGRLRTPLTVEAAYAEGAREGGRLPASDLVRPCAFLPDVDAAPSSEESSASASDAFLPLPDFVERIDPARDAGVGRGGGLALGAPNFFSVSLCFGEQQNIK